MPRKKKPPTPIKYFTDPQPPAPPASPPPEPAGVSGSSNDHARLSPSSSKQWSTCTASLALIEANPHRVIADECSRYADEGTQAHEWAAKVLMGQVTIDQVPDGVALRDPKFPESNFREHVADYVDHCRSVTPKGVKPVIEAKVPLFYQPTETGTCDFAAMTNSVIVIRDLKYGAGVLVSSHENPQLAIYALSFIRQYGDMMNFTKDTVVNIAVFQPRHRDGDNQIAWEIPLVELEKFCEEIEYRATQARVAIDRVVEKLAPFDGRDIEPEEILEAAPGAKFAPGEGDSGACRWCKAKAWCTKRLAASTEAMVAPGKMDPAAMIAAMPDLEGMGDDGPLERIAARLSAVGMRELASDDAYLVASWSCWPAVKAHFADIDEYLTTRGLAGNPVAGTKLVLGREGNRDWSDPAAADTWLKGQRLKQDERYNYKLKSPAQAEKILKAKLKKSKASRNRFEALVSRSEAKKVLALADDAREAIGAAVDAMPDMGEVIEVDSFEL